MSDPILLSYLAGVIDSDGYITITRSTRRGVAYHGARIGIAGTRRQPHDLAASLWGGKVGRYEPKNPRHRAQFQWSRSGVDAARAIQDLRPYLHVKVEQADLALSLHEHILAGRATAEDPFPWFGPDYDPTAHRDEMRSEMVAVLNQDRRAAGRHLDGELWDEMPVRGLDVRR